MFYDDDINTFFDDDEFAIELTYNGTSITGIYTAAGTMVTYGNVGYITTEHELLVKSTDCPSVKKTDTIVLGGVTYRPFNPQPDGTGVTKLYLATNVR